MGIEVLTGPEVLTGSARFKAGTAAKLVLNMLSTTAFVRLGKVYENLMIDLEATNRKLQRRALHIVGQVAVVSEDRAEELLRASGGSVKLAIVVGKAGVTATDARRLLQAGEGSVRRALAAAGGEAVGRDPGTS